MDIAITVATTMPMESLIRGNGIMQNCKFIYDLLEQLGHSPFFLYIDDGKVHNFKIAGEKPPRVYEFGAILNSDMSVPLVLEVGMTINPEQRSLMKERKKSKLVIVRLGNSYYIDLEAIIFHNHGPGVMYGPGADRVWISPHFKRTEAYHESINQCPARISPFIWEPQFVSDVYSQGVEMDRAPNIYVMEPNLNVVKAALVPLCIVSGLCQASPNIFGNATILNGTHINEKPYFLDNIIRNLPGTSSESNKVYFTGRYTFDEVFKQPDILLSFQMDNGLNYLTNEALYKGVPLVHNSTYYPGVGHYYNDFDIPGGVKALQGAITEGYSDNVRKQNREFLQSFSIYTLEVQKEYAALIDEVMNQA